MLCEEESISHIYAFLKLGLLVKFSAYIEIKAMFERTSGNPDAPLQPWQHMVSLKSGIIIFYWINLFTQLSLG
jgi:hypothetical protein